MQLTRPLNRSIDHTLLKPDATFEDLTVLMDEAIKYNFASVCVPPFMVQTADEHLKDHPDIKICTVIGFPHGNIPRALKEAQVEYFINAGADEIDFVVNIGLIKSGLYEHVGAEMEAIGTICSGNNIVSKCIVETCYLTDEEKTFVFRALSENTAVDFIKTSTGFGTSGANLRDVLDWNRLREESDGSKTDGNVITLTPVEGFPFSLRNGEAIKIKAAGGIRDLETALKFIACGADRLGLSSSVKVMEEWNAQSQTFTEGEETA